MSDNSQPLGCDINDTMFGEKIAHGTPFRRAVEEGLLYEMLCVLPGVEYRQ